MGKLASDPNESLKKIGQPKKMADERKLSWLVSGCFRANVRRCLAPAVRGLQAVQDGNSHP